MERKIAEEVIKIIAENRAESLTNITLETRLRQDLQLNGDDVDVLFLDLSEKFDVDFSNFNFYCYFREEPHMLRPFVYLWQGIKHNRWGNETITVGHLIKVVESKTWFDP